MSNLSTFRAPVAKNASGSLVFAPGTGVISYVAPTKLSQFTNDVGFIANTNASQYNSNSTVVQRQGDGRIEGSNLSLIGVPGATSGLLLNAGMEIGRLDIASNPYIDFHSSGGANDWDTRITASGGSNSVASAGTLSFYGGNMVFLSPVSVGVGQTASAPTALTLAETGNATSKRAMMYVGSGWQVGQDSTLSGSKDFFIYNAIKSTLVLTISPNNSNAQFGASVFAPNVGISQATDSILTLEDTSAPNTSYRLKGIFSSKNVNGGNDWLFRQTRPSDGSTQDFILQNGSAGTIWTTGNVDPLIDMRLAFAGDQSAQTAVAQSGTNIYEPYAGAVITGITGVYQAGSSQYAWVQNVRWRYLQKRDGYGNWFTCGYV